jgi:AcrR family transcriptional regulator
MSQGNRERILNTSIELFNFSGTVTITTNHIAKHLAISPGNLYFHFSDKEEIVRELFARLCADTYKSMDPKAQLTPQDFVERSFEVFWTYRFFHREMYHLRRRDPLLSKMWKRHLARCFVLLKKNYSNWVKDKKMREIRDPMEMKMLSDNVLLASSAYLAFFESPHKPAPRKILRNGTEHVNRLLAPYQTERAH